MMKKKLLSALTAVLCCASAVSVPVSLTSAAKTENRDKVYESSLILDENVAHTSTVIDSYIWNNGVKAYTALSNKKTIEVYCHSQEIADQIKNVVFNNGLDASIVEYFIKPMGELNYEGRADDTPVTNDELEQLLKITGELNTFLYERGYIEECGYASLRWGKHSVWLAVQSEAIAEELSAYITENGISENLVDIIIAPEYDYRIPDGGQKEPDEVNTIVVDGYFALKEYLKSNEILSNIYLTARQNESSQGIYNSFVEIQVKSQEDSDAIKKYMLDNYFWDAVVDVTVTQDLSADTENFVYSKDYVCLNGDANDDGKFGISDVVTLQKYILNANSMYERQGIASDMTHDGSVDVFDLCLMKQRLIK